MNNVLNIGEKATQSKIFTEEEVLQFSRLSLDQNPIHIDEEFAKTTIFGKRIVHGMLVASLFSGILGEKLPGKGTIYLGQKLAFKGPVFIGEKITASVEITHIREDKPIITLKTLCINSKGKVVIEGDAVVKV